MTLHHRLQGSGPPMVLISGYASDMTCWDLVLPRLSQHCQVLTLDNRGSGQTPLPEGPCTIEAMAQDVAELLTALGWEQALVVGHSMGGMIAQELARVDPERVKGLLLCCSASRCTPRVNHLLDTWVRARELDAGHLLEVMLSWLFTERFFENQALLEAARATYRPPSLEGMRAQAQALRAYQSRLEAIQRPTFVLAAEEDRLFGPEDTAELAEGIGGSRVELLAEVGHACLVEDSDSFAEAVLRFAGVVREGMELGFRRRK